MAHTRKTKRNIKRKANRGISKKAGKRVQRVANTSKWKKKKGLVVSKETRELLLKPGLVKAFQRLAGAEKPFKYENPRMGPLVRLLKDTDDLSQVMLAINTNAQAILSVSGELMQLRNSLLRALGE